jgi:cytochrome b6-f complex iron-sulfur subunit
VIVVCKRNLDEADFSRLREKLLKVASPLKWARGGGRLVVRLERAHSDAPEMAPILDDPAVDYVLRSPTEREIARLFSRRDLLNVSLATTGALTAAAVLGPLALFLTEPTTERAPRGPVLVGRADTIPVNGGQIKVVDGDEFLVIREDEERFVALNAICTHSEVCLVGWNAERRQVICPCHRGVFDIYGNVVSGPPPRPLARREVFQRNGQLYMRRSPQ